MALQGGHRFPAPMEVLFPFGCYAMSVEQAMDYDEKSGRRTPAKDKQTGERDWTVTGIPRDPETRERQVKVKVAGPVQPVLPGEIMPGSGLHAVDFTDVTITPYVSEGRGGGRARLAYSLRASGVYAQGKAPAGTAPGRVGGLAPGAAP